MIASDNVRMSEFDRPLVPVIDCWQQSSDTPDCAIFVCYVMRQYIHGVEIDTTMGGLTLCGLRATIVKMFLNDQIRGLCARMD
ncbi:unnamed protein product [Camellia sinensis]